ncbi:PIN domain-containing protein [Candidatus Woesearchaeota archaeon]|nr:PIN domain-containing protein [Candidatus Woesearchaeota archaeon]
MAEKEHLIDTCIWRDFYENRFSKSKNPIGKYAADLFMKVLKRKYTILFSEALVWELKRDYDEKEINDMLNLLFINKTLVRIEITKEEYQEAKKLSEERHIPFIDCLNAIQARNYKAVMVSRDEHFINNLSDIVKSVKPEDIK